MRFRSCAEWDPKHGFHDNTTTAEHDTYAQAETVCQGLMRNGLGGERIHFPVRTWVETTEPITLDLLRTFKAVEHFPYRTLAIRGGRLAEFERNGDVDMIQMQYLRQCHPNLRHQQTDNHEGFKLERDGVALYVFFSDFALYVDAAGERRKATP